MSVSSPTVSVIIPNYNHSRYLPERLDSVLNQTYRQLEVILMDDCSTDESRPILEEYARRDSRIRLVFNEQNSGSTFRQWNKGLALATGEYVWIAESDDAAELTLVAQLLAQLETHPEAGLAYCQSCYIDADSKRAGVAFQFEDGLGSTDYCRPGPELVRQYMPITNIVPNASAVLLRRSTALAIGPAPEDMRLAGDWLYWIRLMLQTHVCYLAAPLNYFRSHGQNVRSSTLAEGRNLVEMARVLGYVRAHVELTPAVYRQALQMLVERWFHTFIYSPLTWRGHQAFMHEMQRTEPGFTRIFAGLVVSRLTQNRCSGLKMLVADKLLG